MFSVSRFFMSGRMGLRVTKAIKGDFLKLKVSNFGAKSKDTEGVDKSKRSVSGGGATASDSEKREPSQQTIKVAKAKTVEQPAQSTPQPAPQEKTSDASPATSSKVKEIKTVTGHRVI